MAPWTAASGRTYRLTLVDTNVLSDVLKNCSGEAVGFFRSLLQDHQAPCFAFHTLVELRRREDLFNRFLEVFSVVPWFLMKPWGQIELEELDDEAPSPLLHAFSPLGKDKSYDPHRFFEIISSNPEFTAIEDDWRVEEEFSASVLAQLTDRFDHGPSEANAQDGERFLTFAQEFLLCRPEVPLSRRPAAATYLFSIYYRLYGRTDLPPGEITDVRISAIAPYVEVFWTENFQAEVLKKIRSRVPRLQTLDVFRLRDLRS